MSRTTVHLLRHGEVHNPDRVLYGRIPGYGLSERGHRMAERIADTFTARGADLVHLVASPLQRAQETAAPLAAAFDLPVRTDERVIEAENYFEGSTVGKNPAELLNPAHWAKLVNPLRPSWGEPYAEQAARMYAAIRDARAAADGHEAVIVSHQLPIWVARSTILGRSMLHDPRRRRLTLASLTTLTFERGTLLAVDYTEPCADLLPDATTAVLP
ncbi:histidine phosphatase family protein [Occultella kanbiaonis]|uniref:histidine phosphatase family protein n=1 Tax=Occultella kanbiaonis TaxID=2675754 RepID=UPI0012B6CB43|nr:histidine phosphatase family protein [Occultella kanbiaonis]